MVKIPYDKQIKQVQANGKKAKMLEWFYFYRKVLNCSSGSRSRTNEKKVGKLYYQPYSPEQKNILVVGVSGNEI
jgi:apocytochrome f